MASRQIHNVFASIYGKWLKRDECFTNVRVSTSVRNSPFCVANEVYLAVIIECLGGGSFMVLSHQQPRTSNYCREIRELQSPVTELSFSPHNHNIIASGLENGTVKIWTLDGEPSLLKDLTAHRGRIDCLSWHPRAHNRLLSAGLDRVMIIWNTGTGEVVSTLENHPDMIYSISWDFQGEKVVTACKDRRLRVIDTQSGRIIKEVIAHHGAKPSKAIFLRNGWIFSTGFTRQSGRQISLRTLEELDSPVFEEEFDGSTVLLPLYDVQSNIIYLYGKGEKRLTPYGFSPEVPYLHPMRVIETPMPIRGAAILAITDRSDNTREQEVTRIFVIDRSAFCQIISVMRPQTIIPSQSCPSIAELGSQNISPSSGGDMSTQTTQPQPRYSYGTLMNEILPPMIDEAVNQRLNERMNALSVREVAAEVSGSSRLNRLRSGLLLTEKIRTAAMKAPKLSMAAYRIMDAIWNADEVVHLNYSIVKEDDEKMNLIKLSCQEIKERRNRRNEASVNVDEEYTEWIKGFFRTRKQNIRRRGTT